MSEEQNNPVFRATVFSSMVKFSSMEIPDSKYIGRTVIMFDCFSVPVHTHKQDTCMEENAAFTKFKKKKGFTFYTDIYFKLLL